ncbi:unnamed protein product [Clonostachys solani]|uniref:Uncharacterized protein n=1 Tax=Clonostachys solani TaxID=160281 RepID=A0A9N9Z6Q3_9HYPO|nr:unnamed protein product [Clonostachys solani]
MSTGDFWPSRSRASQLVEGPLRCIQLRTHPEACLKSPRLDRGACQGTAAANLTLLSPWTLGGEMQTQFGNLAPMPCWLILRRGIATGDCPKRT